MFDDLINLIILGTLLVMAAIGLYRASTASGILLSMLLVVIVAYIAIYHY
jgi:hypothetical protein